GGELGVVLLLHPGGHVGGDDTGPHFVDHDALRGQAGGPQLGGHRQAGLGDAVLTAVGRDGHRRGGGDVDDGAPHLVVVLAAALVDHLVGHELGEEVRAAQVDVHHPVVTLRGGFQDVIAHSGGDPGVVHQQVDPAPAGQGVIDVAAVV